MKRTSTQERDAPAHTSTSRMPVAQRRALIIDAAREVFGRFGYHGATTDNIARAAKVSQPYVVRMFGSKQNLFIEVLDETMRALMSAFRAALSGVSLTGATKEEKLDAIGAAFLSLTGRTGLHTFMMQAFVSGAEPAIGVAARAGFLDIYRFLIEEAGLEPGSVQPFLGKGMLFSVLLGVEMPQLYGHDPDASALLEASFGPDALAKIQASTAEGS